MADNVGILTGSDATVAADDIGGVLHQRVKISQGADGSATDVSSAAPLNVTLANTGANATAVKVDASSVAVPVTDNSGSLTVDNAVLSVTGGGVEASALRVTLASDSTGVVSVDDNGGTLSVDDGGSTLTVDGTIAATQSGTWNITNVSGTVSLPTGAATAAKQPALGTAGTASTDVITVQGIASMTALKVDGSGVTQPVSGTVSATQSGAWNVGTVTTITNVVHVDDNSSTLSVDDGGGSLTVDATQSGIWTVQPGNTANTTAWLVSQTPATSGGCSIYRVLSAASTNGANIKASAGQVYGWMITNTNAAARFVKLYNKASSPTVGTDTPVMTLVIPGNTAGAGAVAEFPSGIAFGTGISIAITGAVADSDTTAISANEVVVNLFYK